MDGNQILKRLNKLLGEENELIDPANKKQYHGVIDLTLATVNNGKFIKWKSKYIIFLESIISSDDFDLISFKENVYKNYKYSVVE